MSKRKRFEKRGQPYRLPVASKSDKTIGLHIQGGPVVNGQPEVNLWVETPKDVLMVEVFEAVAKARRAFAIRRLRAKGLL